jgi:hypothetical protein
MGREEKSRVVRWRSETSVLSIQIEASEIIPSSYPTCARLAGN